MTKIVFDETGEFHPMRECIGKTITGTGNSSIDISLSFDDDSVMIFNVSGDDTLHVSLQSRSGQRAVGR
jgi:hypothetical protein